MMSVVYIIWINKIPFLSSSIVQVSLWAPDAPEDLLAHIRFEREQLVLAKKEKIEESKSLEQTIQSFQAQDKTIQNQLWDIQKSLEETNDFIASFPWPDTSKIEQTYAKKIADENTRYEKQKLADQKLYADTIHLINQTYDEKIRIYQGKDAVALQEAQDLAIINRKNALQSLTNIQVENLEKHQAILESIEEEKHHSIEQIKLDNDNRLLPLIQKKESLAQEKTRLQEEWQEMAVQVARLISEREEIIQSLRTIEDDILALDYKIIILEEDILKQIAP